MKISFQRVNILQTKRVAYFKPLYFEQIYFHCTGTREKVLGTEHFDRNPIWDFIVPVRIFIICLLTCLQNFCINILSFINTHVCVYTICNLLSLF